MSQLLRTDAVEIDGKIFTIGVLNFAEARKLLPIVQRALASYDPDLEEHGSFIVGAIAGHVSTSDIETLITAFAPKTTVDFQDGEGDDRPSRVLVLKDEKLQNELFAGQMEDVFTWLDACIKLNFGGLIAKMTGAVAAIGAVAKAKRAAKEAGEK